METLNNNGSELDPNPIPTETPPPEAEKLETLAIPMEEPNSGSDIDPNLIPMEAPEPEGEKLETLGCAATPIVEGVEKISLTGTPLSKSIQGNGDDEVSSESESESENSESEESSSSAAASSDSESSSSSSGGSESSSSSGSDSDDDDDEEKEKCGVAGDVEVEEGEISGSDEEKMVSWSNIDDDIGDEDDDAVGAPIRSKNEIQNLPPVPPVTVSLEPHHQMLPTGVVMSIIGAQVIVEGVEKHDPLNEGSILWLTESRKPLGIVDEVFGPVKNPYYIVRYNSEDEVPAGIQGGTLISFVPEFADHVLKNKDVYKKGYDASGANDEELDDEFEFSDDEKEAEYRRMQRMSKRGVNDQNPGKGKKKNNRNQYSPKEHVVPATSDAPAAPLLDRRNHSSFSGTGQGPLGGTTTVPPFPPLNAGPNHAANGVWTNGTSFPQQPQHVMPPNGFPTNGTPFYPQNTQFSHQLPMPGMQFQQQLLPNPGSLLTNMLSGVQPNIFAQAMLAQGLLGQNQMPQNHLGQSQMPQNHLGQSQMPQNYLGQSQMPQNHLGQSQMPQNHLGQNQMPPNQMAFGLSSPFSQIPPPYFPAQQGFPSTELQPESNPNWNSNSASGSPSQFQPGSSASRGRNSYRGRGRKGWRPAK